MSLIERRLVLQYVYPLDNLPGLYHMNCSRYNSLQSYIQGSEGFKNAKRGTNFAGQQAAIATAKVRVIVHFLECYSFIISEVRTQLTHVNWCRSLYILLINLTFNVFRKLLILE